MNIFWWRVIGVTLILLGLVGVGIGIYELATSGKYNTGISSGVGKKIGPFGFVIFVFVGWSFLWPDKPAVVLLFGDDGKTFKPRFPGKVGDMIVVTGGLTTESLGGKRVFLEYCELESSEEDEDDVPIRSTRLTRDFLKDAPAAFKKYLPDGETRRVTIEGEILEVHNYGFRVLLRGHDDTPTQPDGKQEKARDSEA